MSDSVELKALEVDGNPALLQGVRAEAMDMPYPDFMKGKENPQQAKERLAEQVRRLIMYVGQEGTDKDVEEWVKGLDDDKLVAFAERNRGFLPFELLAFLHDVKERANGQMPDLPNDSDIDMKGWIEGYRKGHGLKKEQIVSQGREAVMEILAIAFQRNGSLTEAERTTVRNMAMNITDETILHRVMDFAVGHSYVVMCLLRNPNFDFEHIFELANKVAESTKAGKHIDECRSIMIEVSGNLARRLDEMIKDLDNCDYRKIAQARELTPKILKVLDQVEGANLFSLQIREAYAVLKNPVLLKTYIKNHSPQQPDLGVNPSSSPAADTDQASNSRYGNGSGNGNGKTDVIRAQNAVRASAPEKNEVFEPGSRRVPPAPKTARSVIQPAETRTTVQSGGSNKAKKNARVAAAKARAAAKRKRAQNGD